MSLSFLGACSEHLNESRHFSALWSNPSRNGSRKWAGEFVQWVKGLLCKCKDLS